MAKITHIATILCDYVLLDVSQKSSLMGQFFTVNVRSFPGGIPVFYVFVSFHVVEPSEMDVQIVIANDEGTWAHTVSQEHVKPPPDRRGPDDVALGGYYASSTSVSNLPFPHKGGYQVQLHINGALIHSAPFVVCQAHQGNAARSR